MASGNLGLAAVCRRAAGARREQVLPVLAVGRAAARRRRGQAGHGRTRCRRPPAGRMAAIGGHRRARRATPPPATPRRVPRSRCWSAGRATSPPAWSPGPWRGTCSARRASRASRRRAGSGASSARSRPGWRPALRYVSRRRGPAAALARHRRQPALLRDLVPDVDLALPELLLPGAESASTALRLTTATWSAAVAVGYLLRRARHAAGDQAAEQARLHRRCCLPPARS